jgi:hypothetical protein
MLLDDIKSVLTFSAFRPEADDPETPVAKRFEGRKLLALNISRSQVTWCGVNRKGKFEASGTQDGDFADVAAARGEQWRALSDNGWCTVSINNRFIISLENGLMRADNTPHLLRTNPRMVLGPKYDRGKRYAICHHPASAASMLLATEDSMVKVTEDVLRTLGLRSARVSCGLFALMEHAVNNIYTSGRTPNAGNFVLIGACDGSVAVLSEQEGQWRDLRCRSGLGTEGVDTALQIISPMVAKAPPGTPVYFIADGFRESSFRKDLMEQLERVGARDLTQDEILWNLLTKH